MAINTVQFQKGMSFFEFHQQFGNEAQCEEALERERWPDGFKCPRCSHGLCYRLQAGRRRAFQCRACNHQASIIAGTLFENTKLPLFAITAKSAYLLAASVSKGSTRSRNNFISPSKA